MNLVNNQVPELTIGDFLEALQERDRGEEAESYYWSLLLLASVKGITPDELLSMTLEECVRAVNTPRGPPGWNTMWGEKIVYPYR